MFSGFLDSPRRSTVAIAVRLPALLTASVVLSGCYAQPAECPHETHPPRVNQPIGEPPHAERTTSPSGVAEPPKPIPSPPAEPQDADEEPTPRIVRFDCTKADTMPVASCSAEDVPEDVGLRTFQLGGPEGAAWNAFILDCAVRIETPCSGKAEVDVFVGNRRVHRAKPVALEEQTCRFGLKASAWEPEFDTPRELLFNTAIFRAKLRQTCGEDPPQLVRKEDAFVAGFAEGE